MSNIQKGILTSMGAIAGAVGASKMTAEKQTLAKQREEMHQLRTTKANLQIQRLEMANAEAQKKIEAKARQDEQIKKMRISRQQKLAYISQQTGINVANIPKASQEQLLKVMGKEAKEAVKTQRIKGIRNE